MQSIENYSSFYENSFNCQTLQGWIPENGNSSSKSRNDKQKLFLRFTCSLKNKELIKLQDDLVTASTDKTTGHVAFIDVHLYAQVSFKNLGRSHLSSTITIHLNSNINNS